MVLLTHTWIYRVAEPCPTQSPTSYDLAPRDSETSRKRAQRGDVERDDVFGVHPPDDRTGDAHPAQRGVAIQCARICVPVSMYCSAFGVRVSSGPVTEKCSYSRGRCIYFTRVKFLLSTKGQWRGRPRIHSKVRVCLKPRQ